MGRPFIHPLAVFNGHLWLWVWLLHFHVSISHSDYSYFHHFCVWQKTGRRCCLEMIENDEEREREKNKQKQTKRIIKNPNMWVCFLCQVSIFWSFNSCLFPVVEFFVLFSQTSSVTFFGGEPWSVRRKKELGEHKCSTCGGSWIAALRIT